MVATYALVYFPEYVVGFLFSYALKNGHREASLIKGSPMNGEPCRSRSKVGRLLWVSWQFTIYQVIPNGVHPVRFGHHRGDSPLSTLTEGSGRCAIGVSLPRSSCEAVASFSNASAREFSNLGTCLT